MRLNFRGKGSYSVAAVVIEGWSESDRLLWDGLVADGDGAWRVLRADICRISRGVKGRFDTDSQLMRFKTSKLSSLWSQNCLYSFVSMFVHHSSPVRTVKPYLCHASHIRKCSVKVTWDLQLYLHSVLRRQPTKFLIDLLFCLLTMLQQDFSCKAGLSTKQLISK